MDVGSRLRKAREAKGLSLDALSKATRVRPRILEALENNEVAAIPPRPYGRSFVSTYAAQVGLDPHATVRDYFLQFARPPQPSTAGSPAKTPPRLRPYLPLGRAAYAIAGVLLVGFLFQGVRGLLSRDATPSPAVAQPQAPAADAVGTGGSTEPATEPAAPAPEPTAALTVELEAVDPVWVTASADARRAIYRTMLPGERETLRGDREIAIRVGDAGAIRWRINDHPDAVMGTRGAVRSVRLTPDNIDAEPSSPQPPARPAPTPPRD
jgi:cytoskeletal protein RodZ